MTPRAWSASSAHLPTSCSGRCRSPSRVSLRPATPTLTGVGSPWCCLRWPAPALSNAARNRSRARTSAGREMSWEAVATFASVLATVAGINLAALHAMFERHQRVSTRDDERWGQIERSIYELRVLLPIEYVRREDWI